MKILSLKKEEAKLLIENPDDLWHLSHLVDEGDVVSGKTQRKIRKTPESEPEKKTIFLAIKVISVEYDVILRISGTVVEGPEDVPFGSHHTFNVEVGTRINLTKPKWYGYQLNRLKEAEKESGAPILIAVFDREDVIFARTTPSGYSVLSQFSGDVKKKGVEETPKGNFYDAIIKQMQDYVKRYNPRSIILASPSFWKEELLKQLTDEKLKKKIVQATCSSVTKTAIDEVLKRPEIKEALKQERAAKELELVEDLLVEIGRDGNVAYGLKQVKLAEEAGAIKALLVSDGLIRVRKQEGNFDELDIIMKNVDSKKGDVYVICSEHSGGKKLDGIGGIGALLRYKVQ